MGWLDAFQDGLSGISLGPRLLEYVFELEIY